MVGIPLVHAADPRIILYKKDSTALGHRGVHLRVARRRPMELHTTTAGVQMKAAVIPPVDVHFAVENAIEAAINETFNVFATTMDGEAGPEPKLVVAQDGFVLNIGRDDWMGARVDDAYAAAESVGNGFKLCLSLDMTTFERCNVGFQDMLITRINSCIGVNPSSPHSPVKGVQLVEVSQQHGRSLRTDWETMHVYFVPSLFTNPAILNTLPFLDGVFNWNGGWPTELNELSSPWQIEQAVNSLNTDALFLTGLSEKTYIAAVSPWFFTIGRMAALLTIVCQHYGPDTWNKNWIYRGDDWLFAKRWEELIAMRDRVGIVEVISWNDYGESHYIGPIAGAQPNSQAWVDGFDHQGWLEMTSYYAQAFKTGSFPIIAEDRVFVWARPHPKDASAPDHVPRPRFADLTDDFFWVVVFAKSPATAILHAPSPNSDPDSIDRGAAMIVDIPAGINKLRYPLLPGRTMAVRLERSGKAELNYRAEGFVFDPTPKVYNFNAWVGWKAGPSS
ncbi:hypothetical protein FRC17_003790 [Serendipita sp. 399]|nr:hypothetical protein FRC17_003790 [Serendipita sp. 399]